MEDGLEGLLHISELADHKVENPEEVVKVGQEIEVKVLRVDADERKIGLSRKRVEWAEEAGEAEGGKPAAAPPVELKGGVGGGSGPLIQPRFAVPVEPKPSVPPSPVVPKPDDQPEHAKAEAGGRKPEAPAEPKPDAPQTEQAG